MGRGGDKYIKRNNMSFFDKAKRAMNIGGAKVEIAPPGILAKGQPFKLSAKVVGGKIDQKISGLSAKLQQKSTSSNYKAGANKTSSTKTYVISQSEVAGFELKAGETKEVSFDLAAAVPAGDTVAGVMGALNSLNRMATGAKDEWEIQVTAMIEGSADTSATVEAQLQ